MKTRKSKCWFQPLYDLFKYTCFIHICITCLGKTCIQGDVSCIATLWQRLCFCRYSVFFHELCILSYHWKFIVKAFKYIFMQKVQMFIFMYWTMLDILRNYGRTHIIYYVSRYSNFVKLNADNAIHDICLDINVYVFKNIIVTTIKKISS